MKPEIHIETRTHLACPGCGSTTQFSWGHLEPGRTWGPWHCRSCGTIMSGKVLPDGSAEVEVAAAKNEAGFLLVRIANAKPPVFFVIEHPFYAHNRDMLNPDDYTRYYVEEHTCPTNLVRVEAILWESDADPHGVLEFVQHARKPADWPDAPSYEDWARLFSQLPGAVIDIPTCPAKGLPPPGANEQ